MRTIAIVTFFILLSSLPGLLKQVSGSADQVIDGTCPVLLEDPRAPPFETSTTRKILTSAEQQSNKVLLGRRALYQFCGRISIWGQPHPTRYNAAACPVGSCWFLLL
jgi:hypothetical protein